MQTSNSCMNVISPVVSLPSSAFPLSWLTSDNFLSSKFSMWGFLLDKPHITLLIFCILLSSAKSCRLLSGINWASVTNFCLSLVPELFIGMKVIVTYFLVPEQNVCYLFLDKLRESIYWYWQIATYLLICICLGYI